MNETAVSSNDLDLAPFVAIGRMAASVWQGALTQFVEQGMPPDEAAIRAIQVLAAWFSSIRTCNVEQDSDGQVISDAQLAYLLRDGTTDTKGS